MNIIHRGFHPSIVIDFIKGETIWFREEEGCEWKIVAPYCKLIDIYRVSNDRFEFSIKPRITTANIHVHVCPRKNTVWATADQSPEEDNIRVTFDEYGTPIAVELFQD